MLSMQHEALVLTTGTGLPIQTTGRPRAGASKTRRAYPLTALVTVNSPSSTVVLCWYVVLATLRIPNLATAVLSQ
jgi:hypothetical protein